MPRNHIGRLGRTGWFAAGVLATCVALLFLVVVADYVRAIASTSEIEPKTPTIVIEGN